MEITYLGGSCVRLRGRDTQVVVDPPDGQLPGLEQVGARHHRAHRGTHQLRQAPRQGRRQPGDRGGGRVRGARGDRARGGHRQRAHRDARRDRRRARPQRRSSRPAAHRGRDRRPWSHRCAGHAGRWWRRPRRRRGHQAGQRGVAGHRGAGAVSLAQLTGQRRLRPRRHLRQGDGSRRGRLRRCPQAEPQRRHDRVRRLARGRPGAARRMGPEQIPQRRRLHVAGAETASWGVPEGGTQFPLRLRT